MKYAARASTLILAGFLAMTLTCVRASGPGGGHGGSGGHGSGGHGGHSSRGSSSGHSSGHSIGHSIGHSFAHIFGHHGQGVSPAAPRGAPAEDGKVTPSPESVPRFLDRQPRNRFVFRHPIGFSPSAEVSALGDVPTDGSTIISVSATIGTVLTMACFSIHFSLAGFPDRFLTAPHLAAQPGLEMGRHPTQRSGLQPNQARRICPQIRTRQTRHRTPAAAPRHHQMV